jgi:hypothetical protein
MKINTNIPGWFFETELSILALTASIIKENSTLVEVGSFVGRSSWTLSQNLPESCKLHCVDPWIISGDYNVGVMESFVKSNSNFTVNENLRQLNKKQTFETQTWETAFTYNTQDCNNITKFPIFSDQYNIGPDVSAVFIDGDHGELVEKDIKKFSNNPETLIFGDDFSMRHSAVIKHVIAYQWGSDKRILLRFPKTKIWYLWPTTGYYSDKLTEFLNKYKNFL